MDRLFDIIHEDADLLVINKPAGLVCHPTKGDAYSSLISRVRLYLQGQPAHMINRIDRETSGIVVVAKNSGTAGELGKAWESRAVKKIYRAIVHGHVCEEHRLVDAPLARDENSIIAIKDCVRSDGSPAQTEYWREKIFERDGKPYSLLRVAPRSGRKHQIRIHLEHVGHPIVGDKLYGGDENLYLSFVKRTLTAEQQERLVLPFHALHACEVSFNWRGEQRTFYAQAEDWFRTFAEMD